MNTVTQSILPPPHIGNIPVRHSTRRYAGDTARLLEACRRSYLGVATKQSADGRIELVAFATPHEVFVISVGADYRPGLLPSDQSFGLLLLSMAGVLIGFDMAKLTLRLHRELKLPVCGIDLSTMFSPNTRDPWRPSKFIGTKVSPSINKFEVDNLWNPAAEQGSRNVCLRAWLSACRRLCRVRIEGAVKVDTRYVSDAELACLSELVRQTDLLEVSKPNESPNEFSRATLLNDGNISLQNARYRSRVRRSHQTSIILTNEDGKEFVGRARHAVGKTTTIKLADRSNFSGDVRTVRVLGRQELTNAEKARDEFLLHVLQKQKTLRNSTYIRKLWFPSPRKHRSGHRSQNPAGPLNIPSLNPSQIEAVSAMVSEESLIIVHGPPGTGKTTTISEAAAIWLRDRIPTWIVAHSNVAVKNIAEKLYKREVNFRILVSKEFHFEWHEHIYQMIQERLIRSDELPHDLGALERALGDTCVVLSTLSMLSNPALDEKGVSKIVPVVQLVIDEASQINLFDFMHLFEKYKNLKKVCFFGDPQQLPPYGKDNVPGLQTIFDLEHLRPNMKFLNVQYRMPIPLGQFISLHVYDGKLKSHHKLNDKSCVSFVNASNGEELKSGFSWKNSQEIQTIVHLVRSYYKRTDFCVITPYDAQRAAIEAQLKSENLPWERVFNVDSFQGNEAKYVLISVVRSTGPGFLTSLRRMNVMLTRCCAGMVIVTSRSFLQDGGRHTLLGSLAEHWENLCAEGKPWVDWRLVAEGKVDLPGALGPSRELRAPLGHVGMNTHTSLAFPSTSTSTQMPWKPSATPMSHAGKIEATFADATRSRWGQMATSQRYPLHDVGTHLPVFEQSHKDEVPQQTKAYQLSFPSLPVFQRRLEPLTGPQRPVSQKRDHKAKPPGKTPGANLPPQPPQTTFKPTTGPQPPAAQKIAKPERKSMAASLRPQPSQTTNKLVLPPPPPSSATVERISPGVIRIISKNPQIDEATKVQKVVENKQKGKLNKNPRSR